MSELLPCPFCGKAPTQTARAEGLVWCASCRTGKRPDEWDARAPIVVTDAMIEAGAAAAWNLHAGRQWSEIPGSWKPFYRENAAACLAAALTPARSATPGTSSAPDESGTRGAP